MAFLRVSIAVSIGLAVPLYYAREGLTPEIIGIIASARALSYLFSPLLFKNVHGKIGKKNCLFISFIGFIFIQTCFQFSLEPVFAFILLFLDGMLLGLFWPVLMSSISSISNLESVRENNSMKDKLMKNYGISWNLGGIFSYLLGTIILYTISDILIIFRFTLIYVVVGFIFVLIFEEPKSNMPKEPLELEDKSLNGNSQREHVEFSLFIPLFMIIIYAFLVGSIGLIYPLKSEFLEFPLFSNYLFNFIRMTCQTIFIAISITFSIKTFKKLIPFLMIVVCLIMLTMGLNENLILFGILFGIFGIFISFLYTFSFKLVVFRNISKNTSKYSTYFETMIGLSFWLGPLTCGFIAVVNINLAFFFLSILALIGFVFFVSIKHKIKV